MSLNSQAIMRGTSAATHRAARRPLIRSPECTPTRARARLLTIMLPNGSSNSNSEGRSNLAGFLGLGRACPIGYGPGQREFGPVLPDTPDILFIVGRPQNAPSLAERGEIDAFICFADLAWEAEAAGVHGIDHVLDLPFGSIDIVVAAAKDAPASTLCDLVARAPIPIRCISELPFFARRTFSRERSYRARFGSTPPTILQHNRPTTAGTTPVIIDASAGSSEPLVQRGHYECCMVVRSSGATIRACQLKVIEVVASACPALFCRSDVRNEPFLLQQLDAYVERLALAKQRWLELQACRQLEFHFSPLHDGRE